MLKAAKLKTKLKYIEFEAKARADLEKVQTLQKLATDEEKLSFRKEENLISDKKTQILTYIYHKLMPWTMLRVI